ncbi:MAG: hypothetical protein ACM3NQ_11790 [Bacteroidales bacterium]
MDPDVDREPGAGLDLLLQRTLTAPRDSENRVVTAALSSDRPRPRSRLPAVTSRRSLAAAAIVLLLVVVAGAIFRGARPPASPAVVRGLVTNDGAVVIIRAPGQPTTFIGPGGAPANLPPGAGSIVLMGEGQ